ncbi:MAG: hypothetical protein ACI8WB_003903 [Phenylobacterium sp.]|jgi:hypothetical protein
MLTIAMLWLPILVSAVVVWIISAIVWVAMPHHKKDYAPFPDEDKMRKAISEQNVTPGLYSTPFASSNEVMNSPEFKQKMDDGPVAFVTVMPNGMEMGKKLLSSFIQNLVYAVLIAYIATFTLSADSQFIEVFRLVVMVTWLAYGAAFVQDAIWFGRPWSVIVKFLFDALLYALATAAIFAWLWV